MADLHRREAIWILGLSILQQRKKIENATCLLSQTFHTLSNESILVPWRALSLLLTHVNAKL